MKFRTPGFCDHRSIVGRTVLLLLAGLVVSHLISIAIYSDERRTALLTVGGRQVSERIAAAYLNIDQANPQQRKSSIRALWEPMFSITWTEQSVLADGSHGGWRAHMVRSTIADFLTGMDSEKIRINYGHLGQFRPGMTPGTGMAPGDPVIDMQEHMGRMMGEGSGHMRQRFDSFSRKWHGDSVLSVSIQLTDGSWFNVATPGTRLRSAWWSRVFVPIIVTTIIVLFLTFWAIRRSAKPLALFAQAAERLGRDVNAPPMPEDGPKEVLSASRAFNEMQRRIQSFIKDRTHMLAAISHDLRTPITRLRLRAELIDDPEQQAKMLADLDQMEQMIAATLSFARDEATDETSVRFDLAAMLQSLADDISDTNGRASYDGPDKLEWTGRPGALKRAFQNLADNAIKYGKRVDIALQRVDKGFVVMFTDDGPGIPEDEYLKVFEPFYRVDPSRNRDTGGVGLGLAVARSVIRAHGGDISFSRENDRFTVVVRVL
jgi:signal transduction histidine kinase